MPRLASHKTVAGYLAAGMDFEVRCTHCTHRAWAGIEARVKEHPEIAQLTVLKLLDRMRCSNSWCGRRGAYVIATAKRWEDPRLVPAPWGIDRERWAVADVADRVAMISLLGETIGTQNRGGS